MEKQSDVSIIVPAYNGEGYISKCIGSLLEQSHYNIELLIVDDGSTDNTPKIIDEWVHKDARVHVIHKENEGVSSARNKGLECCNGKYILFVDSDDELKIETVQSLLTIVQESNAEVILFGYEVIGSENRRNDTDVLRTLQEKENDKIKYAILKAMISTNHGVYGYVWRAMYSKRLLDKNKILFQSGIKISEDYMFLMETINRAERIVIDTHEWYYYCIGENSMSVKYIPSLLHDMMYVNDWMYREIVSKNKELEKGYDCSVCNTYLRYVQTSHRNPAKNFWKTHQGILCARKKYNFQYYINRVWRSWGSFDLKFTVAMVLFRFHMDVLYEFLFVVKETYRK